VSEAIQLTRRLVTAEESRSLTRAETKCKISKRIAGLDGLLLEAVDEAFTHVFREAGAKALYKFIENNCHLKREEIAQRPDVFSAGLEKLLGSGAPVLQELILRKLRCKLELKPVERERSDFADYIKELAEGCSL
jgi:hypothetical protein